MILRIGLNMLMVFYLKNSLKEPSGTFSSHSKKIKSVFEQFEEETKILYLVKQLKQTSFAETIDAKLHSESRISIVHFLFTGFTSNHVKNLILLFRPFQSLRIIKTSKWMWR